MAQLHDRYDDDDTVHPSHIQQLRKGKTWRLIVIRDLLDFLTNGTWRFSVSFGYQWQENLKKEKKIRFILHVKCSSRTVELERTEKLHERFNLLAP